MAFQFNARTVAPQVALDPVPEGWYKVVIDKSNVKPTRDGQNGMIELQCKIIEGQFQTRVLYYNLNLWHNNATTVEIAYKQLSAICHVVGQYDINAPDNAPADNYLPMLHNVPFMVHAVVTQGERGPINNIRGLKDTMGNDPGKGGQAPQQTAQQFPQGGTAPGAWQGGAPAPRGAPRPPAGQWTTAAPQPAGAPFPGQPGLAPGQPMPPAPAPSQPFPGQPYPPQPAPAPTPPQMPGQPQWGGVAPGAPQQPPQAAPQWPGQPGAPGQAPAWGGPR